MLPQILSSCLSSKLHVQPHPSLKRSCQPSKTVSSPADDILFELSEYNMEERQSWHPPCRLRKVNNLPLHWENDCFSKPGVSYSFTNSWNTAFLCFKITKPRKASYLARFGKIAAGCTASGGDTTFLRLSTCILSWLMSLQGCSP